MFYKGLSAGTDGGDCWKPGRDGTSVDGGIRLSRLECKSIKFDRVQRRFLLLTSGFVSGLHYELANHYSVDEYL